LQSALLSFVTASLFAPSRGFDDESTLRGRMHSIGRAVISARPIFFSMLAAPRIR